MPAAGNTLSSLEETVVHEFGHDIHDQNPEAFKRFQKAAGWQSGFDSGNLTDKGLTAKQIEDLKDKKVNDVMVDGKRYALDPYSKGPFGGARFLSSDEGAIPTLANGAARNPVNVAMGLDGDTWDYARTNYKDHFAETYQKAIHTPRNWRTTWLMHRSSGFLRLRASGGRPIPSGASYYSAQHRCRFLILAMLSTHHIVLLHRPRPSQCAF